MHLLPPAQNVAFQEVFRTSSSDTDCIFYLHFETVLPFKIYGMI